MTHGKALNETFRLARNWWILYVTTPVLLSMASFCVWAITWPAIEAQQAGRQLPADWTCASIVICDLGIVGAHAVLVGVALVQLRTAFTKEGVRRPSLFGAILISWSEVTEVIGYMPKGMIVLEIRSAAKKIRINVLYYKDRDQLISLVREHVSSSAQWH